MSYNSSKRYSFEQWWKNKFTNIDFDETNDVHIQLQEAHDNGFQKGWEECSTYDRNWDSD